MSWQGPIVGRFVGFIPRARRNESGMTERDRTRRQTGATSSALNLFMPAGSLSSDRNLSRGMHVFRCWERYGDSKSRIISCCKRHKFDWGSSGLCLKTVNVAQGRVISFTLELEKTRKPSRHSATISSRIGSGRGTRLSGLPCKPKLKDLSKSHFIHWSCMGYQVGPLKPREARRRKWFRDHIWKFVPQDNKRKPRAIQRFFGLVSRYGFSKAWGTVRGRFRSGTGVRRRTPRGPEFDSSPGIDQMLAEMRAKYTTV